jgi:NIPSNAP
MKRDVIRILGAAALLAIGYVAGRASGSDVAAAAARQQGTRVFELRTYTTHPGKLDALNARFRNHTLKLFEKHGMTNVVYTTPMDAPQSQNTLIYLLAHKSREAAKASFDAFRSDPDWVKARTESEAAGPIVVKVDSVFLTPTDYSPMK